MEGGGRESDEGGGRGAEQYGMMEGGEFTHLRSLSPMSVDGHWLLFNCGDGFGYWSSAHVVVHGWW